MLYSLQITVTNRHIQVIKLSSCFKGEIGWGWVMLGSDPFDTDS